MLSCGAFKQTNATALQPAVYCSHEVLLNGVRRVIWKCWEVYARLSRYPCAAAPCKHEHARKIKLMQTFINGSKGATMVNW